MECPQCRKEFRFTWPLYLQAAFGRFACPECQARLRLRHNWWIYFPLIMLGCCLAGIPLGYLVEKCWGNTLYAGAGWLVGWVLGAPLSGVPTDLFLERKFSKVELDVRQPDEKKENQEPGA